MHDVQQAFVHWQDLKAESLNETKKLKLNSLEAFKININKLPGKLFLYDIVNSSFTAF
jgi:hypothetical protein